jgi:hypothetical protein
MSDARLVSLEEVIALDPTIEALADLPAGHEATRASVSAPWHRQEQAPDPD